jgi:hypothetical protein
MLFALPDSIKQHPSVGVVVIFFVTVGHQIYNRTEIHKIKRILIKKKESLIREIVIWISSSGRQTFPKMASSSPKWCKDIARSDDSFDFVYFRSIVNLMTDDCCVQY